MVVHGDGKGALGAFLTHYIGIQECPYLTWLRKSSGEPRRLLSISCFGYHLGAQIDAPVADVHARSGDNPQDFVLSLLAEGAAELGALRPCDRHLVNPSERLVKSSNAPNSR
jgi:hypothetical protein